MKSVIGFNKLRRDPDPIATLANATLEYGLDAQAISIQPQIFTAALES